MWNVQHVLMTSDDHDTLDTLRRVLKIFLSAQISCFGIYVL